jgi:hypothetical protein
MIFFLAIGFLVVSLGLLPLLLRIGKEIAKETPDLTTIKTIMDLVPEAQNMIDKANTHIMNHFQLTYTPSSSPSPPPGPPPR